MIFCPSPEFNGNIQNGLRTVASDIYDVLYSGTDEAESGRVAKGVSGRAIAGQSGSFIALVRRPSINTFKLPSQNWGKSRKQRKCSCDLVPHD